jgi:hypothetical protein
LDFVEKAQEATGYVSYKMRNSHVASAEIQEYPPAMSELTS